MYSWEEPPRRRTPHLLTRWNGESKCHQLKGGLERNRPPSSQQRAPRLSLGMGGNAFGVPKAPGLG